VRQPHPEKFKRLDPFKLECDHSLRSSQQRSHTDHSVCRAVDRVVSTESPLLQAGATDLGIPLRVIR